MNGALFSFGTGRWSLGTIRSVATAWLIAEVVAFVLAVHLFGLGTTVLAMFGTTLLGFVMLRRVGLDAAQQLRRRMMSGGVSPDNFVDGTLSALGAVLLIVPGFVSDLAGLALSAPSLRHKLATRFVAPATPDLRATPSRPGPADVIDLAPEDWRVVDKTNRA